MNLIETVYVLLSALLIGLTAAALPPIVRALPPFSAWVQRGIKPWACDLCMSVWSTLIAGGFWWLHGLRPWATVPGFILTFALVRFTNKPVGPPPGLPELEDSSEVMIPPAWEKPPGTPAPLGNPHEEPVI